MTSFIKLEVHNVLQRCQRMTKPWQHAQKIGFAVQFQSYVSKLPVYCNLYNIWWVRAHKSTCVQKLQYGTQTCTIKPCSHGPNRTDLPSSVQFSSLCADTQWYLCLLNYLQYSISGSTFTAVGPFQLPAPQSGTLSRISFETRPSVQTVSGVY